MSRGLITSLIYLNIKDVPELRKHIERDRAINGQGHLVPFPAFLDAVQARVMGAPELQILIEVTFCKAK
ncbi:MAG: hypothetical protein KTR19_11630 [Hyphomicrobiales bacterium]|nr:hypothetical protein [Hyphomicrobiales bacterium]